MFAGKGEDFIPPFFHPTSVDMQEGSPKPRHKLYGGIAASVALHVIIAVALFVRLPAAEMQPPQEASVSVEIVPPPEEQAAEEKPPEPEQEQALNLTMPEEKPEEQEPPPPPPEPAPEPAAEAKAEPPPPPPPPPAAPEEKAQAEEPPPPPADVPEMPPEEEASEQQQVPPPSEPSPENQAENEQQQAANGRPLPVLRPVFEFGEESKGSAVSPDGNASEAGEVAKAEDAEPDASSDASKDVAENGESEAEAEQEAEAEAQPAAPTLPSDVAPPSIETAGADPLATSDDGTIEGILADIAAEPVAKPTEEPTQTEGETAGGKPMEQAKRLFSQRDTSDALATTAMGNVPRGARASQLCTTELREQLRHGSPAYQPEILPSYSLPQGNVLDIRSAAFRAGAQWYDVRFRCEIDDNATKVVSFGFEVGDAVPRSQWKARRFPEF